MFSRRNPTFNMPAPTAVCPFCSLLCDDLAIAREDGRASVIGTAGCARAVALFPAPPESAPRIAGRAASWKDAVHAAAAVLADAAHPLIGGLACDIDGLRGAVSLAERIDGILDHMDGQTQLLNRRALQDSGWVTTTLSEVRNRADVVVLAGTRGTRYPRLFERCLEPIWTLFGDLHRRLISMGEEIVELEELPVGTDLAATIRVPNARIAEVFGALRARLAGQRLDADAVAGVPMEQIDAQIDLMKSARYGVLMWDAADLDSLHADLAVSAMISLVNDLNRTTRWSLLPLGGSNGGTSVAQVCAWLAGYPPQLRFSGGVAQQAQRPADAARMLDSGQADALLWINAFDPQRPPPASARPTVVVGRPDLQLATEPAVFLPVAVPGSQARGLLSRMDQVVTLPLAAPAPCRLPTVAAALAQIMEELPHVAAA